MAVSNPEQDPVIFTLTIKHCEYASAIEESNDNSIGPTESTTENGSNITKTFTYHSDPYGITIKITENANYTTSQGKRLVLVPKPSSVINNVLQEDKASISIRTSDKISAYIYPYSDWNTVELTLKLVPIPYTVRLSGALALDPCYGGAIDIPAVTDFLYPNFYPYVAMGAYMGTLHGMYSTAIGLDCMAVGAHSQAFGAGTKSYGEQAHAEGNYTTAQANNSHAEGNKTFATGESAHAEGERTNATERATHAEGYMTYASNFASHVSGKFNKAMTTGGYSSNTKGDAFVIGNGTDKNSRSNAFRVTYGGAVYGTGEFNTSGADYAEFFEWQDGNPDAEDRVGRFVTMDGEFIRYASQGDYILGIVSGNPAVVGNSDEDYKHRWLKDDFGRFIREYLEPSEELIDTTDMLDDDLNQLRNDPDVEEREGAFYRKTEVPTDHVTTSWRFKQSPDYNPDQPYTERKDRPEWDYVGMLGVLAVYDDGTCEVNSYCQCGENGIATKSSMAIAGQSFRVIKRIGPNIVKVVFR